MKPNSQLHPTTLRAAKPTLVTLAYHNATASMRGSTPYEIIKLVNDISIAIRGGERYHHVGAYLTEEQAAELVTESNVEVTVVRSKE